MVKFKFFVDTGRKERKVIKKTKVEAVKARARAKKKGFGVSKVRRSFF